MRIDRHDKQTRRTSKVCGCVGGGGEEAEVEGDRGGRKDGRAGKEEKRRRGKKGEEKGDGKREGRSEEGEGNKAVKQPS